MLIQLRSAQAVLCAAPAPRGLSTGGPAAVSAALPNSASFLPRRRPERLLHQKSHLAALFKLHVFPQAAIGNGEPSAGGSGGAPLKIDLLAIRLLCH